GPAAAGRRTPPAPGGGAEHGLVPCAGGAGGGVAARCRRPGRRRRDDRRLPARRLAGALRHRAGGRPAVGADAAADLGGGAGGAAGRAWALAAPRQLLPAAVPVPADGTQRRVPDRRPVQPVRVLRGAAGRVLRAGAAWFGRTAGERG